MLLSFTYQINLLFSFRNIYGVIGFPYEQKLYSKGMLSFLQF